MPAGMLALCNSVVSYEAAFLVYVSAAAAGDVC
jgi:hypothetical protein